MKQFLIKVLIEPTDKTNIQLFRYTFVGGIAFLADFFVLYLLTDIFNVYHIISATFGFLVGLLINYVLSKYFVFNKSSIKNRFIEFSVFAIIGLVGLALTDLFMWILTDICEIYYLVSKLVTTIVVFIWNFCARKYLIFN